MDLQKNFTNTNQIQKSRIRVKEIYYDTGKKNAIVDDIMALLIQLTDEETIQETSRKKPVEMLTIKECTQAVKGLSEHTVRQLVAQNKVKYIRTGQGKRGKILINKEELLKVFEV